ncbi:hypothetical protein PG996_003336 [Apiospora saccharicola]|uniref:FAD dependent oxidoreductase domain-containing protein n=1 Tax=Apiospora saccharicola TaxID=335842 RepID=A0ABR1W3L0_9PEZI
MASMQPLEKNSSVLIIGAGTWGTSIAYRLVKRGYTNIKVLDSNKFPSSISAGNDHNKILEEPISPPAADQSDLDYAWNTIETLSSEVWRNDPVYAPHYHPTGFIYAAVGDEAWEKVKAAAEARPDIYAPLEDAEAFRQTMPDGVLTGDLTGWRGFIRREGAGWVEARDVLLDVYAEATKGGATFVCDPQAGRVAELLYEGDEVLGAKTADGETHRADFTILAAGAGATTLVDFEKQLRPTAWTLGHVALTADEAPKYAELPVLFTVDGGFFLSPPRSAIAAGEPELKICDEHPGYIHLVGNKDEEDGEKQPVPVPRKAVPRTSATNMQKLLQATVPQLADRPLLRPRLCWDADTPDRLFLIARHPRGSSQRLLVAAGGSGNGFMNSPAVGILVADLLENQLDERMAKSLRWRPETAVNRDWFDTQGRFGGAGKVVDLGEIPDDDWVKGPAR